MPSSSRWSRRPSAPASFRRCAAITASSPPARLPALGIRPVAGHRLYRLRRRLAACQAPVRHRALGPARHAERSPAQDGSRSASRCECLRSRRHADHHSLSCRGRRACGDQTLLTVASGRDFPHRSAQTKMSSRFSRLDIFYLPHGMRTGIGLKPASPQSSPDFWLSRSI